MENKEKAKEVVSQFIRHLYVSGSQQEQVVDLIAQALREAEATGAKPYRQALEEIRVIGCSNCSDLAAQTLESGTDNTR